MTVPGLAVPRKPLTSGTLPVVVGRGAELAELRDLLEGGSRLTTLSGPGGVGKSVLARVVAEEAGARLRDGLWLLDVSVVAEPDLLALALASVAGVHPQSGRPVAADLAAQLADRHAVLVLDGCDDLVEECAVLAATLLAGCPGLVVLATSRQALLVPGEAVLVLGGLSSPDPGSPVAPAEAAGSPAVALFLDRARAVVPGFTLTEDNLEAVLGICATVEGLPLALELAAARVQLLSPKAILERLGDRYRLLTKGDPEGPHRHRSLRAAVEASYALCSREERLLWTRLSVFTGSVELTAVEAVCSGDGIDELDVLDLVDSLLQRSVLARVEPDPSEVRYRLSETLRAFGDEHLDARDRETCRLRHLAWYAAVADDLRARWFGPDQVRLTRRFGREHSNLRAAIGAAALDPGQAGTALRMLVDLEAIFMVTGRIGEARRCLDTALGTYAAGDRVRDAGLASAAWLAALQHDVAEAERRLAEATAPTLLEPGPDRADRADDHLSTPECAARSALLRARGAALVWAGRGTPAEPLLRRSTELAERAGDRRGEALSCLLVGVARADSGDLTGALEAYQACGRLTEAVGERHLRTYVLSLSGLSHLSVGDEAGAVAAEQESLRIAVGLDDEFAATVALEALATLALGEQDGPRAVTLLAAADAARRRLGVPSGDVLDANRRHHDTLEAARATMGTREVRRSWERGGELDLVAAAAYALGEDAQDDVPAVSSPLTPREDEVAALIGQGRSNREIAAVLHISHRTAQGHVENILRKLGFGSRTQVAAWVAQRPGR